MNPNATAASNRPAPFRRERIGMRNERPVSGRLVNIALLAEVRRLQRERADQASWAGASTRVASRDAPLASPAR